MASAVARSCSLAAPRPVQAKNAFVGLSGFGERQLRELSSSSRPTSGSPIRPAEATSRSRCSARPNGPAAVDAQRLECRPSALERLVVRHRGSARRQRRARVRVPPQPGSVTRATGSRTAPRGRREAAEPSRATPRSLDVGSESQTMPPPTQRWMRSSAIGERPDREREIEVAVRARRRRAPPSRRHARRARARRCDRAPRSSAPLSPTRPGRRRSGAPPSPTPGAEPTLDGRDEMADACERTLGHELRPANGSRHADAREIVSLEIDDHHVLGRVLLRGLRRSPAAGAAGCP